MPVVRHPCAGQGNRGYQGNPLPFPHPCPGNPAPGPARLRSSVAGRNRPCHPPPRRLSPAPHHYPGTGGSHPGAAGKEVRSGELINLFKGRGLNPPLPWGEATLVCRDGSRAAPKTPTGRTPEKDFHAKGSDSQKSRRGRPPYLWDCGWGFGGGGKGHWPLAAAPKSFTRTPGAPRPLCGR